MRKQRVNMKITLHFTTTFFLFDVKCQRKTTYYMMSNEADGRISGNNIVTGNKGVGKKQHPRVNLVCGSVYVAYKKSFR